MTATTNFNEYPKLGVWPDGYYMSFKMFNGNTFVGSRVCAFDRAKMLVGDTSASQQCFQLSSSFGGLLPSDLDGSIAPPTGSINFFLNFGANWLNLWKCRVNFGTPANSALSGPTTLPVAAFSAACSGGGACVPQPGTSHQPDSLADRLMYRLACRNRGGVESLVANHSVSAGGTLRATVTSVRWYELRNRAPPPRWPQAHRSCTSRAR